MHVSPPAIRLALAALMLLACPSIFGCRKEKPTKEEFLRNLTPEQRRLLDPMQSTPLVVAGVEKPC
jgi:hypothetical protein